MQTSRLVGVLAIVTALFVAAYGPGPRAGPSAPAADGPVILVDALAVDPLPFVAAGGEVLANYGNGYFLMRVPGGLQDDLRGVAGVDTMDGRTTIDVYYSGVRFDTAIGEPSLPASLRATAPGAYLLQFVGPIQSHWVTELERAGLAFDAYLANYAFVVTGSPAAIAAARASPRVGWVGTYHPGYKLEAGLTERAGPVQVSIVGLRDASSEALAERVASLGGVVQMSWDEPPTVIATVAPDRLAAIAHDAAVLAVQEYFVPVALDKTAGQIHKFAPAWDTRRSGLSSTLTGRSPGPDGVQYDGTPTTTDDYWEGAGILDTGFDEGDANDGTLDFFDSPNGDRVTRLFRHTGPTFDGKCGSAHGSHVAGIVASDGYAWETYLIENVGDTSVSTTDKEWHKSEAGVAPEAKISLDGVQNGNDIFCGAGLAANIAYWDCQYLNGYITVPITGVTSGTCGQPWIDGAVVATHNAAIDTGSRAYFAIHTNSWGSSARTYGATANGADTRMNAAPERLVVFAAGNDGPDLNTVSGEALLKNGLSIGAGQNYRPEQFESDNPNLVAGFSARGGPGQSAGRIKPDLIGIGTSVVSLMARGEYLSTGFSPGADLITWVDKYCSVAKSYCSGGDGYADYRYLQGTSMAAPHAAGLAILVREYLREVVANNVPTSPYFNPPSYLVKAIMVNGAVRMDPLLYDYPGYDQGWGRIDLEQSLFPPVPRTNQFAVGEFQNTGTCNAATGTCTGSGNTMSGTINLGLVGADVPLKVTLVWLDNQGDALTRNLDLRVLAPGGAEYHGNQYTSGWSDSTKTGYDGINNVEQVEVEVPETGTWTVEVRGVSIPNAARFALIFSANVGPSAAYKVDLSTEYPTSLSVAPSGSASLPLTVTNFGLSPDTVQLSSNAPAGLLVTYLPANSVSLAVTESQDVLAVFSASPAVTPGIYDFDLRAVSGTDPSPTPASDFVPVRIEVLASGLPFPYEITNGTVDELDPSVLTFDDGATDHIFIAYRKTSKVSADGLTGGVNVWVAHATLDGSGFPILPFVHTQVSGANDNPNDLRLLRIQSGTYLNRVVLSWTGNNPAETNPDATSWSRMATISPPYASWAAPVTVQQNEGSLQPCNTARVSFPLFRVATGGGGQLIYVWETLANTAGCTSLSAVTTNAKISTDGGSTWGATTQVFPPPGNPNLFFFPNGYVDQNDVAWVFAYWRTPTGNDRDLTVRLFDNAGWGVFPRNDYTILDTTDNVQWPAVLSTSEGTAGNRVYVTFTRDNLQADLKMYLMYTDGDYTSAGMPVDYRDVGRPGVGCGPGCMVSADFAPPVGPGLRGPYGTSVSSANYNRRPILNIERTTDGIVWLPHIENANAYSTPNLWTYSSSDGYATAPTLSILTADAFAKGHQMSSTLLTCVYEVYHSSRGTSTQVNYEVFLLIYGGACTPASDLLGPLVSGVAGTPNPVNKTSTFRLTANLNDITTGNSDIAAAEYSIDSPSGPWTAMTPAEAFDSPTESAYALIDVGVLGWPDNDCHAIYVRGQDVPGNWGPIGSVEQCTDRGNVDLIPPSAPTLTAASLAPTTADVRLSWDRAADEGAGGGTVAYRVYRATGLGGSYVQMAELPGTGSATYTWTDTGAGHGDPQAYLYRIRTVDAGGNEAQSVAIGAKYARPLTFGWHLLSVPVLQVNPSVASTFQTITFNRARTFVAADTADPWKAYVTAKPSKEFTVVDPVQAYWVNVQAAGTYTVAGLVMSGTPITLQPGWNFVGFPSLKSATYTVAQLKAATPAVTQVEGYDALGPYYLRRMIDSDALEPARGYWLYNSNASPVTWLVP